MTQGERAIRQEQRRMEKEKKRRIELANKMLIPVGEKTSQSLGLLSFDPSGVFRLGNNLWLKVFTLDEAKKRCRRCSAKNPWHLTNDHLFE